MPRVTITVPEKPAQPYRFQLDRKSVTLGRGSENDIPIDCGSISVKHAEMRRIEGGYELRDLGSTNGIKLDGERCDVIPLRNGLPVRLGDVAFDFLLTEEELEALAAEKSDDGAAIELPPIKDSQPIKDLPRETRHAKSDEEAHNGGFVMILLFLILAAAAFAAGMAIRYQKETGESLLDAIKSRSSALSAPAGDPSPAAPAPEETKPGE